MKLIVHNLLQCNIKNIEDGYPLQIISNEIQIILEEYNPELLKVLVTRINLEGLKSAVKDISEKIQIDFPYDSLNIDNFTESELDIFLRHLHHLLHEIQIIEGYLVCPVTGRKFPIQNGIPNMLLHEDEI